MKNKLIAAILLALAIQSAHAAEGITPAIQAKLDAKVKEIQAWAADASIVGAVKKQNGGLPADAAAMNQDKWKGLTVLDPFVRTFSKNEAGQFLKSKKTDEVSEAFLSDAAGFKVAFLSKPTNWNHKGKAKHDDPMAGKNFQGPVEVDESSGVQQVQVAVPVLDGGKAIGSLVVGVSLNKLK